MLTLEQLKSMPPQTIFATGTIIDSPDGLNMTNSYKMLRWVAVRGGIWDWAIYAHYEGFPEEFIAAHGSKVHRDHHIKTLVPCNKEAFDMYRH